MTDCSTRRAVQSEQAMFSKGQGVLRRDSNSSIIIIIIIYSDWVKKERHDDIYLW